MDLKALVEALGGPVRLATGRELAEVFGDCEWGAAPPFGRLYGLETLLEDDISPDAVLVFETHTPHGGGAHPLRRLRAPGAAAAAAVRAGR